MPRRKHCIGKPEGMERATRAQPQGFLDVTPDWEKQWWGMPEFISGDASTHQKIVMNFLTAEDVQEFAELLGKRITKKTKSLWFKKENVVKRGDFCYVDCDE